MNSNLAAKLRTGTQQSHTDAEHTDFMKRFLKSAIDKESFCKLLGNLYYIYSQLEAELECHKNQPLVQPLYFPELNRKANLEKDLGFYYGKNWSEQVLPTAAAQAYISRIREVSSTQPVLLIAHAYTRYMGDLSGGQMLQKIAESLFGLHEHQGITFYDFDRIPDLNAFKGKYREALDSLAVDEATIEQIVAEANLSFSLNIQMLRELGENQVVIAC